MKYCFNITCNIDICIDGLGLDSEKEAKEVILKKLRDGEYSDQFNEWAEVKERRQEQ